MKDLVSVIVPIYKVEQYITRCVDSIISQTYSNLEIILVDDGSPDSCPAICDEYANNDTRVKVVHKKNGGLSDARNAGLEAAKGEYVAFIDGDDYISSNYVQVLLDDCMTNDSDISCCGFYKVYEDRRVEKSCQVYNRVFTNLEAIRDIFTANSLCEVMTWNKLYRRSLFIDNDIRFPVGKLHEDNFTTYKLFYFANKISFINEPLYYYIQRSDSIMGRAFNARRFDIFDMLNEAEDFLAQKNVNMENELQSARVLSILSVCNSYVQSRRTKDNDMNIQRELSRTGGPYGNVLISKKHKALYFLARTSLDIYGVLRSKFEKMESHRR